MDERTVGGKRAEIWQLSTGLRLAVLSGDAMALSADGRCLVISRGEGLEVWDCRIPCCSHYIPLPGSRPREIRLSADGQLAFITDDRLGLYLLKVITEGSLRNGVSHDSSIVTLYGHADQIERLLISRTGERLVSQSRGVLRGWQGKPWGHSSAPSEVLPPANSAVSASPSSLIRAHHPHPFRCLFETSLDGTCSLQSTGEERFVLTSATASLLIRMQTASVERLPLSGRPSQAWFLPPDRLLSVNSNALEWVELDSGRIFRRMALGSQALRLLEVSIPEMVAITGREHEQESGLRVWDLNTAAVRHSLLQPLGNSFGPEMAYPTNSLAPTPLAFVHCSPTGDSIVGLDQHHTLYEWDLLSGACTHVLALADTIGDARVLRMHVSTRAERIVLVALEGIWCIDLVLGQVRHATFSSGTSTMVQSVMTSDGQWLFLATVKDLMLIRLDSLTSGRVMCQHYAAITCMDITPDGRLGVTGGADQNLILWRIVSEAASENISLECWQVLAPDARALKYVKLSAEGTHLLSVDISGRVRLWSLSVADLARGELHVETQVGSS